MRLQRLKWVYKEYPVYYLTLDAYDHKKLFANRGFHQAFIAFCKKSSEYEVAVGRYVLMPDHIHLFAVFGPESTSLSHWTK